MHMGLMDKKQLREFIKENNIKSAADIQNALKDIFKDTLQEMLEAALDDSLGYTKNHTEGKETENRRNSHSMKAVHSEYGEMNTRYLPQILHKKHAKSGASRFNGEWIEEAQNY